MHENLYKYKYNNGNSAKSQEILHLEGHIIYVHTAQFHKLTAISRFVKLTGLHSSEDKCTYADQSYTLNSLSDQAASSGFFTEVFATD